MGQILRLQRLTPFPLRMTIHKNKPLEIQYIKRVYLTRAFGCGSKMLPLRGKYYVCFRTASPELNEFSIKAY